VENGEDFVWGVKINVEKQKDWGGGVPSKETGEPMKKVVLERAPRAYKGKKLRRGGRKDKGQFLLVPTTRKTKEGNKKPSGLGPNDRNNVKVD